MKATINNDDIIVLKQHVDHEINWLRYYAHIDSKRLLTNSSSIYEQLVSIGYAKVNTALWLRCASANYEIMDLSAVSVNRIKIVTKPRSHKDLIVTALELYLMMFPEEFNNVKKQLLI